MALFSGAGFLVNVLAGRWLEPEAYGAFAVAYCLLTLLYMVQTALLVEPMLIFGAGKHAGRFSSYLDVLLRAHWLTSLAGVPTAMAGGVLMLAGRHLLGATLLATGMATPGILYPWFVRRACYVVTKPQWAAAGSGVYFALQLAGVWFLFRWGGFSPWAVVTLMGMSGLIVGWWLQQRLGRLTGQPAAILNLRDVWREHWNYGRWSLPASLLSWVPVNGFYILLPVWGGLGASAALRALMNLVLPAFLVVAATETLLLPAFSRARAQQTGAAQSLRAILSLLAGGGILYWLCVVMAGRPLMKWLYASRYDDVASLTLMMGALPLANGANVVLSAALRAAERPDLVFRSYLVSAVITIGGGLATVALWSVTGAVGTMLTAFCATVALLWFFHRHRMA
jgi:O-antigen/teichoic acid export membrane protein